MTWSLAVTQLLNGLQLGLLLFLLAAGLTLVFGVLNVLNLAQGSLYMIGAFVAATVFEHTGTFTAAALVAILASTALGLLIERFALSKLYERHHLDQVLATFGLVMFFNEAVRVVFGPTALSMNVPRALTGTVSLLGLTYPAYRVAIMGVGLSVALGLYLLVHQTRLGMLIRAGASNPTMVGALGVDIHRLHRWVFALGAALAGLAGVMAAPIVSVQSGMGEPILILSLVVIVTGGIGSVRGAFFGALLVGLVDTAGRAFLPLLLRAMLERDTAQAAGPAIGSLMVYLLMAIVLAVRPAGLVPVRHG